MAEVLTARDGDVLVVSYPEVKIPLSVRYAIVTVGGLTYSRKMVGGENVQLEYERIYQFLKDNAEHDARDKVAAYTKEMSPQQPAAAKPPALPKPAAPKPAGVAR